MKLLLFNANNPNNKNDVDTGILILVININTTGAIACTYDYSNGS